MLVSLLGICFSCFLIYHFSIQFEKASLYLGRHMSAGVRGATLNAVSSSLPELFTAFLSLFLFADKEGFAFGVGTAVGSAVFNIAIIPALAILAFLYKHRRNLRANKKVMIRDGAFLLFAEFFFLFCLWQGELTVEMLALLVSIYLLYTITLYLSSNGGKSEKYEEEKIKEQDFFGNLLKLDFANLFLSHSKKMDTATAIKIAFFAILGTGISCHFLVESCYHLSDVFQISPYFTAVLLAAAATSVPDTVLSVRDAFGGRVEDALANALGSNIFDICIGLGVPALLYVIFVEPITFNSEVLKNLLTLDISLIILTVLVLFIFVFSNSLKRIHSVLLMLIFSAFIGVVLAQMNGIHLL
ncbi:MAG: sodium:calcium antiporter [Alphaproteobacteria bacterium]